MAKMYATGASQSVIQTCVDVWQSGHAARPNAAGAYQEARVLRIHEGATEVQKMITGRDVLRAG